MFAQDLNSFKYVVVPNQFEFLRKPNEYQVNALTRFLFEKYGFQAFMEKKELPADFNQDRCNALYADVQNNSGLFVTRLKVVLQNCNGQQVFSSEEGTSREKDFKKAYHEALREAFKSFEDINYHYTGKEMVSADPSPEKKETTSEKITDQVPEVAEVKAEKPKEQKVEEASEPLQKSITGAPKNEENERFIYNSSVFYLKKDGDNFKFFQQGMQDPFAELIASSREDQFIYSSFSGKGLAYFDDFGNLVVEIPGENNTTTETRVYKLKE